MIWKFRLVKQSTSPRCWCTPNNPWNPNLSGPLLYVTNLYQSHPESWHQIPSLFLTSGDLMILLSFIGQGVVHDRRFLDVGLWGRGKFPCCRDFLDMAHGLENLTKHLPLQLTTTTGIRNTTLQPCHSTTTQLVLVQQNPKKKILKLQKSPKSTFLFPKDLPFSIILPHSVTSIHPSIYWPDAERSRHLVPRAEEVKLSGFEFRPFEKGFGINKRYISPFFFVEGTIKDGKKYPDRFRSWKKTDTEHRFQKIG